ncbi:MAG: sugar phosphate isomerase/epimerase [Lachnospiraceae bacterium]|nr:sugar phosphate isomerase/epimerase [Lachnospiraceae bacterium]
MKFGLITNNLAVSGMNNLLTISLWAKQNGFEDLELGPSIPLDVMMARDAAIRGRIKPTGLIYCRNVLDPVEGPMHIEALKKRIDFAGRMGMERITCSTGLNAKTITEGNFLRYDPEACLDEVREVFMPLLEMAYRKDVTLCFEMCPMMNNVAISPYMWERLFEKLDAPNAGMVFDPSHLVWEMIDPYEAIRTLGKRIKHVHGKDCVIDEEKLMQYGILHLATQLREAVNTGEGVHGYEHTWWYYRLPGLGTLDWTRIMKELKAVGFDGTISIEHEDPVYSGDLDKVKQGILMARDHIRSCMNEE